MAFDWEPGSAFPRREPTGPTAEWAREQWQKHGPVFYAINAEVSRDLEREAEKLNVAALGIELLDYLKREALEQKVWVRLPNPVRDAFITAQRAKLIPPDWHQDAELAELLNKYRTIFGSRLGMTFRIKPTARSEADANRNPS